MKNFYRWKESILAKKQIASGKITFLWEKAGVYQASYVTRTDQVIPNRLIRGHISGRGQNCNQVGHGVLVF